MLRKKTKINGDTNDDSFFIFFVVLNSVQKWQVVFLLHKRHHHLEKINDMYNYNPIHYAHNQRTWADLQRGRGTLNRQAKYIPQRE